MNRNLGKFNAVGCAILLRMKFRFSCFILIFSICLFAFSASTKETAQKVLPICELKDARINESSGLAASTKYPFQSLLVTHNDSGGEAKLFYFNLQGETVAEVLLNGATNIDWEDIAIAGDYIYVGDIGDNLRRRESVTIYRLREPEFHPKKLGQKLEATYEKMTLKYPDAPCDAETLIATASGEIILVSKNGGPSRFYKTPRAFKNGGTQTLKKIGEYSFKGKSARSYLATGGDLVTGETQFVVRTYTHAYVWLLNDYDWTQAIARAPAIQELPQSKQGEAICYEFAAGDFFVSEEGTPAPIWKVPFLDEFPF